ncbi:hypothetical protein C8R47DRAFT_1209927 [Mycena vitilis]|nr:hypothetical protein C8R47DRAFT_1209927 [Mycena vitilis]
MTTAIQVRFEGYPFRYPAIPYNIPRHSHPFEPMPDDATVLVIPRDCLFVNYNGCRREIPLENARKWWYDGDTGAEIVYAQAKSTASRFCLRLILNAERFLGRPNDHRYRVFSKLLRDAKFHSTHLVESEGYIVPAHYGMWIMDMGDWGGKVFFSITEWGGTPWNALARTGMNTEANRILVARTFEQLHDSGFQHGDITGVESFRHAVIDTEGLSKEDLCNGKARCYIVGFSEAQANHRCQRKLPILPLNPHLPAKQMGCDEAARILLLLNFTMNANSGVSISAALDWHKKYRELHPDQSNMVARIAQRARLFPDMPQVWPYNMTITFEDESDIYSKVILIQEDLDEDAALSPDCVDSDEETEQPLERLLPFRSDSSSPEPEDVTEPVARKMALVSLEDIPFASKV